jgi:hypothetical protein
MKNSLQYRIWSKKYKMFTSDPRWPNNQSSHELHLLSPDGKVVELVGNGYDWQEVTDIKQSEFAVQRYTGLKDSKGKKIFEGDILDFPGSDYDDGPYKLIVKFDKFSFWSAEGKGQGSADFTDFLSNVNLESNIIGNILKK